MSVSCNSATVGVVMFTIFAISGRFSSIPINNATVSAIV
jgi:hypothetical protein